MMPHPQFVLPAAPEGRRQVYTFWKGRVALYAILKALDIGSGDRVLLPGYTCMAVPSAVMFAGAQPLYADVEAASYNVTLGTLEAAVQKCPPPRPKAVIIQHTYGIPVEAGPIIEWARSEGMAAIEDCAHVMGSSYHGAPCGSLGDAAFFSSQWNKPITTGLGGWAVANNQVLAQRLSMVRGNFINPGPSEVRKLRLLVAAHQRLLRPKLYWQLMGLYRWLSHLGLVTGSSERGEFRNKMPRRYALTMSGFQERLLARRMVETEAITRGRRGLAALYERQLSDAGISLPRIPPNSSAVFLRYPILVSNKRDFLQKARERRLEVGDWFVSPLHPLKDNWDRFGYRQGTCPVAECLCERVVNLPTLTGNSHGEALRIIQALLH